MKYSYLWSVDKVVVFSWATGGHAPCTAQPKGHVYCAHFMCLSCAWTVNDEPSAALSESYGSAKKGGWTKSGISFHVSDEILYLECI